MFRAVSLIFVLLLNHLACVACLALKSPCDAPPVHAATCRFDDRTPAEGRCCSTPSEPVDRPASCPLPGDCFRPCESPPPPPEPAPKDANPRCCLLITQVVFAPTGQTRAQDQQRAAKEPANPDAFPSLPAAGPARARRWQSPTRSGLPELQSRTRRAMLCVRTV